VGPSFTTLLQGFKKNKSNLATFSQTKVRFTLGKQFFLNPNFSVKEKKRNCWKEKHCSLGNEVCHFVFQKIGKESEPGSTGTTILSQWRG
jgi:hypothetical protein